MLKVSIKAMRVNSELTQEEAAKRIGVNPVTLINWESNRTAPTAEKLKRLCKVYGCQISDIFLPDKLS